MLFNSYEFILAFLPLTCAGFFLCAARWGSRPALLWLTAASLFFYGWWNPPYLLLLLGSAVFNYAIGTRLSRHPSRLLLGLGVAANLLNIGYFKYANFFVDTARLFGADWSIGHIVLPLAISFFTFQLIAYLVDSYRGEIGQSGFPEFLLFVCFFPQLIAGPIVHFKEVVPQFHLPDRFRPHAANFAIGLTIFAIGLFKKAVLADGIAVYASPIFAQAEAGRSLDFFAAWGGALSYTFQLYFDFSGYSDMAIGGARLFGIVLPLNFNSPYKAVSIIDFWRRWHMTLSRFLRDYLYIALGGNRKGKFRRYVNLLATMMLGGLWHGAGWTFVLWGTLHGLYLVVNNLWREIVPPRLRSVGSYRSLASALTFVVVVISWTPFRAPTIEGAGRMLAGMAGLNGFAIPNAIAVHLGGLWPALRALGLSASLGGGGQFALTWIWVIALFALSRFAPNTQQIMAQPRPALGFDPGTASRHLLWRPTPRWALAASAVATLGLLALSQVSEFLYFQF